MRRHLQCSALQSVVQAGVSIMFLRAVFAVLNLSVFFGHFNLFKADHLLGSRHDQTTVLIFLFVLFCFVLNLKKSNYVCPQIAEQVIGMKWTVK